MNALYSQPALTSPLVNSGDRYNEVTSTFNRCNDEVTNSDVTTILIQYTTLILRKLKIDS